MLYPFLKKKYPETFPNQEECLAYMDNLLARCAKVVSEVNTAEEIFSHPDMDKDLLDLVAQRVAERGYFDIAIDLVRGGAYKLSVSQVLYFRAPHLLDKLDKEELAFFRERYESDPQAWWVRRTELTERFRLKPEVQEDPTVIERFLAEQGFGLKHTKWD